jgi:hypothetical protein
VGAGKSTVLDLMIAQSFRIPGMQVFVFDKGYSAPRQLFLPIATIIFAGCHQD